MHVEDGPANIQCNSGPVLQCSIAYNAYGGYCVPLSSSHRPAARTILAGRIWEPDTIEFLRAHCKAGDIIHAGTYFGDFLPALSRAVDSRAMVWAFEPNPENYRCARITTYVNGLQNVELTNAGLGERAGLLPLLTRGVHGASLGGASRITQAGGQSNDNRSIDVRIVTIDETFPSGRKASLIQLDVEGFERQALAGALATIRRCKPILVLESVPEENWLAQNLGTLGYRLTHRVNGNFVLSGS